MLQKHNFMLGSLIRAQDCQQTHSLFSQNVDDLHRFGKSTVYINAYNLRSLQFSSFPSTVLKYAKSEVIYVASLENMPLVVKECTAITWMPIMEQRGRHHTCVGQSFDGNVLVTNVHNMFLQIAYFDRFGDIRPSLSPRRRIRYSFGDGKHITTVHKQLLARDSTKQLSDEDKFRFAHAGRIPSDPISSWLDITLNENKLNALIRRVQQNLQITIFLSSPFSGCESERIEFMKTFFPKLTLMFRELGIYFSVIDLRWGVTKDMADDQKVITACTEAIDRCDLFIGYYGARYGTSTLVPGNDYIKKWLEYAATKPDYKYLQDYYSNTSITEMEWQHAFLHDNFNISLNKPICCFLYRDLEYDNKMLTKLDKKDHWKFSIECDKSAIAAKHLKANLFQKQYNNYTKEYANCYICPTPYSTPIVGAKHMFHFCEIIYKKLKERLQEELLTIPIERIPHLLYMRSEQRGYCEVGEYTTNIHQYIHDVHCTKPLFVYGLSGSGKSLLMASTVQLLQTDSVLLSNYYVIYHFIGCNYNSTLLTLTITRLWNEFILFIQYHMERLTWEQHQFIHKLLITNDLKNMNMNEHNNRCMWDLLLSRILSIYQIASDIFDHVTPKLPSLVVILDGINYFHDISMNAEWFPLILPKKMKLIVSTSSTTFIDNSMNFNVLYMKPLQYQESKLLINTLLNIYHKTLDEKYLEQIIKHTSSPMFITLILHELILYSSFESLPLDIQTICTEIHTLPQMIIRLIDRAEKDIVLMGYKFPDIVHILLQYIYISRDGLSLDILMILISETYQKSIPIYTSDGKEIFDNKLRKHIIHILFSSTGMIEELISSSLKKLIVIQRGKLLLSHNSVRQAINMKYFNKSKHELILLHINLHQHLAKVFNNIQTFDSSCMLQYRQESEYHYTQSGIRPKVVSIARLRPFLTTEKQQSCVLINGNRILIVDEKNQRDRLFTLDLALDNCNLNRSIAQENDMYQLCGNDIVSHVLNGINVSVIAYGQTGSGKTYTMFGNSQQPGLISNIIRTLLYKFINTTNYIECNVIEVYNNILTNLLANTNRLQDNGNVLIHNADDIVTILDVVQSRRATMETAMNVASSRSHCIITVNIVCNMNDKRTTTILQFVDLAGSERLYKSKTIFNDQLRQETIATNSSLLVLNKCLLAASKRYNYVPYHESMLTRLLKDSIGGTSKTFFIATIRPCKDSIGETLATVAYATRARSIPTELYDSKEIELLKKQADKLRRDNIIAKKFLVSRFGFSSFHLKFLVDYYSSYNDVIATQFLDTSWLEQKEYWCNEMKIWKDKIVDTVWIDSITIKYKNDLFEQRRVDVVGGETISISINILINNISVDSVLSKLEFMIDENIASFCEICFGSNDLNGKNISFDIVVPTKRGLFMLWYRVAGDINDAINVQDRYRGFCAWIHVIANQELKSFKATNDSLREAVNLWCTDQSQAEEQYGHISTWDTSNVTEMKELFKDRVNFDGNITNWNVDNVNNMASMFHGATSFNHPLNKWNVSNVTNMFSMFHSASSFNQPLHDWNISNLIEMRNMFYDAVTFNQHINTWNPNKVTVMSGVFCGATQFNQPLNNWNVSQVINMRVMFSGASSFNQPLNNWDVSKVTVMTNMFAGATLFNQPLDEWDVSNVKDMTKLFSRASSFNQSLISWVVKPETKTDFMFSLATAFCGIDELERKWDKKL